MKRLIRKSNLNKTAGWVSINFDRTMAVSDSYGLGDDSKDTHMQRGVLTLDTLQNATGFNGEDRQWHEKNGRKYFGNYTEERWNEFLQDIQQNGVQEEIIVEVYVDGSMKIYEGNHRIEACKQLNINEIPAKVYYKGQSEHTHGIDGGNV